MLNVVKLPFRVKFSLVTNVVSYVCYFVSISYLIYYVFLFRNYSYFLSLSLFSFSCFILLYFIFSRTFKLLFFWVQDPSN